MAPINVDARARLFSLFEGNLNPPADDSMAAIWYRARAAAGDPSAQAGLGLRFQFARGVQRHWTIAYALYNLAKRSSHAGSKSVPDFTGPPATAKIYMDPDAWKLVQEMEKPGNLLAALDNFTANPPQQSAPIMD